MEVTMTAGIMDRLREETLPNHKHAESREYESALASGRLPRELFVAGLGQRLLMHRAVEPPVRELARGTPALQEAISDALYQEQNLRADLAHFGVDAARIEPLAVTGRFVSGIERAARERPIALLGAYYVFEGSKNGARMIANAIRTAYGLTGDGTRYLDPHGAEQRPLWRAFRERLNAIEFKATDGDAIVGLARFTFDCIADLDDEIMSPARARMPD